MINDGRNQHDPIHAEAIAIENKID